MKKIKKVKSILFLLTFIIGLLYTSGPVNVVQAALETSVITNESSTENSISPRWNAIGCASCGKPAAWVCLRNKAFLYDTGTHGNCTKMAYKAPSAYHCTWCGWHNESSLSGQYHYCFMIHSSCGQNTQVLCPCDFAYVPDSAR